MTSVTEMIYSNEYADYILPYGNTSDIRELSSYGAQILDPHYCILHDDRSTVKPDFFKDFELYDLSLFTPNLFHPLSTVSLESAGITKAQSQPYLNLTGKNTLIGFLDSGIDYLHPAFMDENNNTRIEVLWDQEIYEDVPNPYHYGTIYSKELINEAIKAPDPYKIVPSKDETGHGTALAGIAAGTPSLENDFSGAAYEAGICVVKLKSAKQYLRNYTFAKESAVLYQENDLMMGIRFLEDYARRVNRPLIICLGLGTNQGDHGGGSPLSRMITYESYDSYTVFAIGTGNEGDKAHHYSHAFQSSESVNISEVVVPEDCPGFTAQLWGTVNSLYSVGFESPIGTVIAPASASAGKSDTIRFILEETLIELSYSIVAESGASQWILMRFINPIPGNWIIRIYNSSHMDSVFHIWLPAKEVLVKDVVFLNPDPDTTLTVPSDAELAISTGFYNGLTNGIVSETGRGFTRNYRFKPEVATPGINVTAPINQNVPPSMSDRNRYGSFSGSSTSAALLAGGAALLQQWRNESAVSSFADAAAMKAYIIRGAVREYSFIYPNPITGYGKTNIYRIFETLIS